MSGRSSTVAGSLLAAGAAVLLTASSAGAHGSAAGAKASSAQHLHEHEIVAYWQAKILKMTPAQKRAWRKRALTQPARKGKQAVARRLADQPVGPASTYGAWTSAPFKAPTYGIHAMLLPTGRVLLMSMGINHGAGRPGSYVGQDVNNDGAAAIWDPTRGTGTDSFKFIAPPPITLDDPQRRKGYNKLRPAPSTAAGTCSSPTAACSSPAATSRAPRAATA